MLFTYKPTKLRTHGRLTQSPRKKIRTPLKKYKLIQSALGYKSFVRT